MNRQIDCIKKARLYLLDQIRDVPVEQLNETPAGFNNNIVWNLGHLTAAQQGICYIRAGMKPVVEEKYILPYKTGTKPEQFLDDHEVEMLKGLLLSSIDRFETDLSNNVFSGYNAWTTRYGVEITNNDDAIQFLLFHEGLHLGTITALKRLVKK